MNNLGAPLTIYWGNNFLDHNISCMSRKKWEKKHWNQFSVGFTQEFWGIGSISDTRDKRIHFCSWTLVWSHSHKSDTGLIGTGPWICYIAEQSGWLWAAESSLLSVMFVEDIEPYEEFQRCRAARRGSDSFHSCRGPGDWESNDTFRYLQYPGNYNYRPSYITNASLSSSQAQFFCSMV